MSRAIFAFIVEFLMQPQNKSLLYKFNKIWGDTRKTKRYHENRSYSPRILARPGSQTGRQNEHLNFEKNIKVLNEIAKPKLVVNKLFHAKNNFEAKRAMRQLKGALWDEVTTWDPHRQSHRVTE